MYAVIGKHSYEYPMNTEACPLHDFQFKATGCEYD